MSQGSPPRMKIAGLFSREYPWFFETHHKYLLGFGEHRSKKWLLPSSLLDSQAISVRRVQPTTHYGSKRALSCESRSNGVIFNDTWREIFTALWRIAS